MVRKENASHAGGPAARSRRAQKRMVRVMAGIVVVAVAFVGGFLLRGNTALMTELGVVKGVNADDLNPGMTVSGDTRDSISARVAEIEGILAKNSLDSYDLNTTTTALLSAFVDSTEDPYLQYFNADRYATYVAELGADAKAGIGVLFAEYNGQAYAAEVFDGSQAQIAGVQQGDFVKAIDGVQSDEWTTTEVVNKLTRQKNDTVLVTWRRPSSLEAMGGEEFTTALTCFEYQQPNVKTELIGTVGYISITQFSQNASSLIASAVQELTANGATSFVLDLRDCPGGFLTQAVDTASLFIKSGTIVQIKTRDASSAKTASGQTVTDKPLVVLVNGNTAAAAEVLAAALQDSGRATIVGTKTMGKGTVQVVRELSFGGAIRYTAAKYVSPQDHEIAGYGVAPDISVAAGDAETMKSLAVERARSL